MISPYKVDRAPLIACDSLLIYKKRLEQLTCVEERLRKTIPFYSLYADFFQCKKYCKPSLQIKFCVFNILFKCRSVYCIQMCHM